MPESPENNLQAKYELRLTREGMPAEISPLVSVPEFVSRAYEHARQTAFEQSGDELPAISAICQEISATHPLLSDDKVSELARAVFASNTVENIDDYNLTTTDDTTFEMTTQRLLPTAIEAVISNLNNEAEREVIRQRYLGNKTLTEIGKNMGVTRERTRQIADKALSRLRSPNYAHMLEMYADDRPFTQNITPEARINSQYERAKLSGTLSAKHLIYLALRDLPSSKPAHAQNYTWGHRRVLERELKEQQEIKDRYLLHASHFPDALSKYKHAANRAKELTEQIDNIRSGAFPTYTWETVLEIELTNLSHDIQATAIELARYEPGSGGAIELTKQQHRLIAYQKELLLAKHAKGNIRWDDEAGDWVPKYI